MKRLITAATLGLLFASTAFAQEDDTRVEIRELREKLERLERKLAAEDAAREKKSAEERAAITEQVKKDVMSDVGAKGQSFFGKLMEQTKVGAYGSMRYGTSNLDDLHNTFTFRRLVLTIDSPITERLKTALELEFERFTELEVEKRLFSSSGVGLQQAVEATNHSEISLEQAWMQYDIADWFKLRAGAVLVPLGRFNINHDDNRWDLPRRSLVDRGVPVLPVKSAWSEVGMGFQGDIPTQRFGKFSYQVYVMNGVTLDSTLETVARASGELETEVEIQPRRGTANLDFKRDKAGVFRLAWSPTLETEIATSVYYGRYTPDFLPSEALWGVGVDGKATFGPFEVEGEYIVTKYNGITRVARGFANAVLERQLEDGTAPLNTVVDFELAGLASTKQGYWLDLRYRFFPDFLRNSIFGWKFDNPQFIATTRMEQVWLDGLVQQADFTGGELTKLTQENRFVDRATLGLAYRPVPLVVFQLAFERTWTNKNKSLAAVTNFVPAQRTEDTANAFLFGVAFGF